MSTSVIEGAIRGGCLEESELPCRQEDPELYFAESPSDVELAKSMCRTCPVRLECLASALERREPWGVWGGELFLSGAVVPRKRPRGRPRKDNVVDGPDAQTPTATSAAWTSSTITQSTA